MPKEKKDKKVIKAIFWEVLFFCLILFLGIYAASEARLVLIEEDIELQKISFENFILYFLISTVFILFLISLQKVRKYRKAVYKFIFAFSFVYGALTILPLFFPDIITLFLILFLLFLWFKISSVWIHDIAIVIALSGLGAILGLAVEPRVVVLLLLVLSFYDFIAVYKTRHMIKIAESMLSSGVIMGLILPKQFKGFNEKLKNITLKKEFMVLGGGDIVFPLIFSVSLLDQGIISALIVAGFSLIGLITSLLIFLLQKETKPIPALPPIALFSIIGYIITIIC
jgi:presenilin-like A22 family membrane protease